MPVQSFIGTNNHNVLSEIENNFHFDLLSILNLGILCLDGDEKIICFNSVLEDLTGIKAVDAVGKDIYSFLLTQTQNNASFFHQLLTLKNKSTSEGNRHIKMLSHDGCLKYFSCKYFPYSSYGNYSRGTLCVLEDKTVKTVCSNESLFGGDNFEGAHFPFVSFLWRSDEFWSVEYVSDNIAQFGYSPDDFISGRLSYSDIIDPAYLNELKDAIAECSGDSFSKEYKIVTADGDSRWVLERSHVVRNEVNAITHFYGAMIDISEMKKFRDELELVNRQEKALSALGEFALSCRDINSLMDNAVETVAKTLDAPYCIVMEKLPDYRFLLRYGYGISDWCIGSVIIGNNEPSPTGFTLFSGKPLIMKDTATETRFKVPRFLLEHGVVSAAGVIIGNRQDPFGILSVHTNVKRDFSEHDINFLQSVSNILSESLALHQSFGSLELYKKLVDHSNDYLMVLDTVSKKLMYASERVIRDLGYTESELMSQSMFDPECFMKTLDILEVIRRADDEGSFLVCSEFTRKNGTSFPVDISFSFAENEGKIYMVLIGRDVSEQKKANAILRESETKLSAIFESASDLICVSDFEGTILQINKSMANIMGYEIDELLGRSIIDFTMPAFRSDIPALMDEVLEKGVIIVEIELIMKNGGSMPMEMKAQLMEYNGQKRLLSIGRDIRERRILEEAIKKHSEQLEYSNEIKNLFADITSHDLIGYVSLIEGFTDYLYEIEEDGKKAEILDHIKCSTVKLKKTIDSATNFASINGSGDMIVQTFDLRHMFNNSLDRLLSEVSGKNLNVVLKSLATCPALINPIIEEVFFNLLSNAIKYSPAGSEITVEIIRENEMWKVSVSDHGPGISNKDKERIFDRFNRAGVSDVSGKGLGLAIARMALKCHDQDLYVMDNKVGKGTTFWFNVPVSHEFLEVQ